jgi:hypothetical protein
VTVAVIDCIAPTCRVVGRLLSVTVVVGTVTITAADVKVPGLLSAAVAVIVTVSPPVGTMVGAV